LEERVAYVEKELGASAGNNEETKNSVDGRLGSLEKKLKDFGLTLDGKGHKSEIEKLESVIVAGIDKRLTTVEQKHLQDFIKRLQDYEKKHLQDFDEIRTRFGDVDKALKECANIEHYLGLDRKHGALSEQQAKDNETAKEKLSELQAKLSAHEAEFDGIKRKHADGHCKMTGKVSSLEAASDQCKRILDDVNRTLQAEASNRDRIGAEDRIARLENAIAQSMGNFETTQAKMRETGGRIDSHKSTMDSIAQRLAKVESDLENAPGNEILKEVDYRLLGMQDDQKRARDILESSILEQLRLEHSTIHSQASQIKEQWDREIQARQSNQTTYQELLGQERVARETQDQQMGRRLETFERNMFGEIQRLWTEVGKEVPPVIVQQAPTTYAVKEYVMPPANVMKEFVMPPVLSPRTTMTRGASLASVSPQGSISSTTAPAVTLRPITANTMTMPITGTTSIPIIGTTSMSMPTTSISAPLTSTYSTPRLETASISAPMVSVPQYPSVSTTYTAV
jgi:uncharacterized coiled-coil protein SlyX